MVNVTVYTNDGREFLFQMAEFDLEEKTKEFNDLSILFMYFRDEQTGREQMFQKTAIRDIIKGEVE